MNEVAGDFVKFIKSHAAKTDFNAKDVKHKNAMMNVKLNLNLTLFVYFCSYPPDLQRRM